MLVSTAQSCFTGSWNAQLDPVCKTTGGREEHGATTWPPACSVVLSRSGRPRRCQSSLISLGYWATPRITTQVYYFSLAHCIFSLFELLLLHIFICIVNFESKLSLTKFKQGLQSSAKGIDHTWNIFTSHNTSPTARLSSALANMSCATIFKWLHQEDTKAHLH
jgi:hypothetical protein